MTQNINNLPDFESKENKYKMLIDFSPDCIKIFNSENKIEYLSKGGLEEHNFHSEQDAIGFNWLDSVVPEQRDGILAKIKESIDEKKTVSIDVKHLPEFANREWCSVTIKPIFNDDGSIKYFIGISRDISERKRSEIKLKNYSEEQKKLNNIMVGRELKMIELKKQLKEKGDEN